MEKGLLGTQTVAQIGIIVKNIQETAKQYAEFLGVDVPEIVITDEYDKAHTEYMGKPSPARAKLAFFRTPGAVEIELIEPDEHPSTWREFLETHGEGVHHIAFFIKDTQGKVLRLEQNGMALVQKGDYTGGRYAYIDSTKALKVMTELLEND
jgi:catechol 2,3-dioxygenase-like lactoylglutathione lyase family enzyme